MEPKGKHLTRGTGHPSQIHPLFSWALEKKKAAMSVKLCSPQEAEAAAMLQCQEHRGIFTTPQAQLIPAVRIPTS